MKIKSDEFSTMLHVLKKYIPKHDKYVILKNNLVDHEEKIMRKKRSLKKNKKKNQKKSNFLNILKINQKISATICLESILILKHLLTWQKKIFEIKDKKKRPRGDGVN